MYLTMVKLLYMYQGLWGRSFCMWRVNLLHVLYFLCQLFRELTNIYNSWYYYICICLLGNDFSEFVKYWNLARMFPCIFILYFWDRMGWGLCLVKRIFMLVVFVSFCLFPLGGWGDYVQIQRNIYFDLNKWTRAYGVPCRISLLMDNQFCVWNVVIYKTKKTFDWVYTKIYY